MFVFAGYVVDFNHHPVDNAIILVEGTNISQKVNDQGAFWVPLQEGQHLLTMKNLELSFSMIGHVYLFMLIISQGILLWLLRPKVTHHPQNW